MNNNMSELTAEQNEAITTYADILNEVRTRILSINTIISNTTSLPPWLTAELGYIQLRMLCELVALGCLIAHGDLKPTKGKKFQKEYAADHIIKSLEQLHSNFYPHPVICDFSTNSIHIERIKSGFLTKDDLLKLYYECGDYLHRGSISKIYNPSNPKQPPQIERVLEWGKKFSNLLSQHHIASFTNKKHLLCFLSHHQANGSSFVVIAQSSEFEQHMNGG